MGKRLTKTKLFLASLLMSLWPIRGFAKEAVPDDLLGSYAMTYNEAKDRLAQFTSKVWFGNDWLGLSSEMLYLINTFVQAIFWVTKSVFTICAGIYEYLSDLSVFDYYVITALTKSDQIFTGLRQQFLPIIGISMAIYVSYVFFVKNGSFVKTLLRLLVTFACASMFFMQVNGKYVVKHFYDGMTVVTEEVAKKTFSGITFGKDKRNEKAFSGSGQSAVLDKYFDIAIWTPYKYLNGDVTGKDGSQVTFFFTNEEYKELLDYTSGDDDFKLGGKGIKEVVGTVKEPKNTMMKASWGSKFTYAVSSLVDAFVLGAILDVFAVSAFAMRLMIILLIILGAFVAVIAMFPTMDNVLLNLIKRLGINLAVSGLMSFFALVILWFYDVLSEILGLLLAGQPFLMAFAKVLILWYLYKKRHELVAILTANRVSHLSNRLTNSLSSFGSRMSRRVQDNALSKLRLASTAGKQTALGAVTIGARKTGQTIRRNLAGFNPYTRPDVTSIREAERQGGNYDLPAYERAGRERTNLESFKDVGRHLSSFKHTVQGNLQKVRAEGIKDKDSLAYKDLRTKAEHNLSISQAKKAKALGYKQRASNQETKERLMRDRTNRKQNLRPETSLGLKPKPQASGFKQGYVAREQAVKNQLHEAERTRQRQQTDLKERLKAKRANQPRSSKPNEAKRNYFIKERQIKGRRR